jgi:phosphoribosylcarboxyaminoimidazole (NCAIR) mutase
MIALADETVAQKLKDARKKMSEGVVERSKKVERSTR